jgi:peroxiredoxin-like protein
MEGTMGTRFEYGMTVSWTGDHRGFVKAESAPDSISFSAPPEFKGLAGYWTPEHFLIAAAASCFMTTFRAIAEFSHFDFLGLAMNAIGTIEKQADGWRFAEIRLHPVLTIARQENSQLGERLLAKAEKACLVARSLACPVRVEASVEVEEEIATQAPH